MKEQVFQVIQNYHMIEPGMRIIAGVSGGADSVCLLHILEQYRHEVSFDLLTVHVEHGLRGEESLQDAAFVKTLCESMEIPCRVVSAQVRQRMREEGLSSEEAGRAERYRIFQEVAREWGAGRIAVAHNQNDQAETVLWNLARGSGLKGLGGIRPVQGSIIRPLLFTDRTQIEAYLRNASLTWRTDRTNLETDYTRNRIRHLLLPQMEADLNAQATSHIAQAAERLREVQEYLDKQTDEAARRCIREMEGPGAVLLLAPFNKEETLIRRELFMRALQMCAAGMKDIGAVHLKMLERLAEMDCGKSCDLPGGVCAVREEGIIRFLRKPERCQRRSGRCGDAETISPGEAQPFCVTLPVPGQYRIRPEDGFVPAFCENADRQLPACARWSSAEELCVTTEWTENSPELKKLILQEKKYTKWISYDTIKTSLLLRTRRTGDYLVVNADGGTKKLKDYLIDQKIPRSMRDQILLLADGSHILWVIGWRISEAARVTDNTRQVLKIQITSEGEKEKGE